MGNQGNFVGENLNIELPQGKEIKVSEIIKEEKSGSSKAEDEVLEAGINAENVKVTYRKGILWFMVVTLGLQIIAINVMMFVIIYRETHVSDTQFKYFITGVFANIIMIFKGITSYLYSDKSSSLLKIFKERKKK